MKNFRLNVVLLGFVSIFYLSACVTPSVYRPEVDMFQKATSELNSYVKARQKSVIEVRDIRRNDILKTNRPIVKLSQSCRAALDKLNQLVSDKKDADECGLVPDDERLKDLFNPFDAIDNSVAFTEAVKSYAESLDKIARCGDKAGFLEAAKGLGDSVISLAGSAAEVADKKKPDPETFTPIAGFIASIAYYDLENRKTEALKEAARNADKWIALGSAAVSKVMMSTQFEIASYNYDRVFEQLDALNEANEKSYVKEADKAITYTAELRRQLGEDSGLPFKKLAATHEKLLKAFEDRKRYVSEAIVISQDLYKSAKDSYDAIKK